MCFNDSIFLKSQSYAKLGSIVVCDLADLLYCLLPTLTIANPHHPHPPPPILLISCINASSSITCVLAPPLRCTLCDEPTVCWYIINHSTAVNFGTECPVNFPQN